MRSRGLESSTPCAAGGGTRAAIIAASFGALVAQMCLTVMAPVLGLFQSDLGLEETEAEEPLNAVA